MKGDVQKSTIENRQDEKRIAQETKRTADEEKRKKAYVAKEEELGKISQIKASERAEKRASQEIEQLSRDQARKKIYLEREKNIAEAERARKLGNKILE